MGKVSSLTVSVSLEASCQTKLMSSGVVPGEESMVNESQMSDMNVLTLERNSHNFLE